MNKFGKKKGNIMLKSIHIKGLFKQFDYDIYLKDEGITILTGPNGYGKTTILKVLDSISRRNNIFLLKLQFESMIFKFDDYGDLEVKKDIENVILSQNEYIHSVREVLLEKINRFKQKDNSELDYTVIEDDIYRNKMLTKVLTGEFPYDEIDFSSLERNLHFIETCFIKEQRLLKKIYLNPDHYYEEKVRFQFNETIDEYSKELIDKIRDDFSQYSQIAQSLDSSYPNRLFDEKGTISEKDFIDRFSEIKIIQKSLNKYGLSVAKEEKHPNWTKQNSKALLVYLNDTEQKLSVFNDLLTRLDLFTEILNKKSFTNKTIEINREKGLVLKSKDEKNLTLTDLSSGEQQEVVFLYELLFRAKPGTLVLFDEPEISLHVAWQKEFLDDLKKITDLQKLNVIVATHSPQIINQHWDWVVDLEEIVNETVS